MHPVVARIAEAEKGLKTNDEGYDHHQSQFQFQQHGDDVYDVHDADARVVAQQHKQNQNQTFSSILIQAPFLVVLLLVTMTIKAKMVPHMKTRLATFGRPDVQRLYLFLCFLGHAVRRLVTLSETGVAFGLENDAMKLEAPSM